MLRTHKGGKCQKNLQLQIWFIVTYDFVCAPWKQQKGIIEPKMQDDDPIGGKLPNPKS
jgi:hypothetical protein